LQVGYHDLLEASDVWRDPSGTGEWESDGGYWYWLEEQPVFAPIVRPFAHAKVRPGRTTGKSFLGACVQSRFFRRVVNQDPRHSTPHPLGAGIDLMLLGSAMRVNVGRRTAANKTTTGG
jgi:hypothetical protein